MMQLKRQPGTTMNKLISLACVLTLAFVAYAFAQEATPPSAPEVPAFEEPPAAKPKTADVAPIVAKRIAVQYIEEEPEDIAAIKANSKLLTKTVKLDEKHDTLRAALNAVHEQTGVNMVVNWNGLNMVEISPNAKHGIGKLQLPANQLLKHICMQSSAVNFHGDIANYRVTPTGVYVSTTRDVTSKVTMRIYDIRPLLRYHFLPLGMMLDDFRASDLEAFEGFVNGNRDLPYSDDRRIETLQRQLDHANRMLKLKADDLADELDIERDRLVEAIERSIRKASEIKGGGGLFLAGGDDEPGEEWTIAEYTSDLEHFITSTVGNPDEWLDEESVISEQGGRLIVQTHRDNHVLLEKLLNGLLKDYQQRQVEVLKQMQTMRIVHEAYKASLNDDLDLALLLVDQTRKLDPNDPTAYAVEVMLKDQVRRLEDTEQIIRRRLITPITVNQDQPTLKQALRTIGKKTKSSFNTNWDELEQVGITADHKVTFIHLNRQGNTVLQAVLDEINKDLEERDQLGYTIRSNRVVIDLKRNINR